MKYFYFCTILEIQEFDNIVYFVSESIAITPSFSWNCFVQK